MASDKKANTNLHSAKTEKNDEFYTQLSDIQAEISHYPDKFKDKVVFCNCDDPFESNFVKYFLMNFNRLGLKELIATGYKTSTVGGTEIGEKNTPYALRVTDTSKYLVGTQKDLDIRGAKYFLQTEGDKIMTHLIGNPALDENGKQIQITIKEKYTDANGKTKTKNIKQDLYYEAGDFRSDMSLELLKQSDIVVTNPPFSLFREYIAVLMQYQKDFLIIGNKNAITYKEFFPLLKNNKVWIGNDTPVNFILPDSSITKKVQGLTRWFTTLDHPKRHQMLPLDLGFVYEGHEDMYLDYDNYKAINVDKTNQIPCDYKNIMGVPISFLDKYCPEQFSIVGASVYDDTPCRIERCYKDLGYKFYTQDGKESGSGALKDKTSPKLKTKGSGDYSISPSGEFLSATYVRLFIKFTDDYINAHPEQFGNGDVEFRKE